VLFISSTDFVLVTVKIVMKHKILRIRELYVAVYCTLDISYYSFFALKMWFTCIMHESWEQTYIKCNIRSCCCKIHQTPNQTSILTFIHFVCSIILVEFFLRIHKSACAFAVLYAKIFQDLLNILFFWHMKISPLLCFTSIPRK